MLAPTLVTVGFSETLDTTQATTDDQEDGSGKGGTLKIQIQSAFGVAFNDDFETFNELTHKVILRGKGK